MSLQRRLDVGHEAFRNSMQLQHFMLTDVTPTSKILGTGSYGSVEEVVYKHLPCAAKRLHETLVEAGNDGVSQVVEKYLKECQLMSSLRHPNITQFFGLCILPNSKLPLLVMELLETSLDDLLEHMPDLPLSFKCSALRDVAGGLVYLHDRPQPIIHRDLTAMNTLLTSSLQAKISDLGNSRIIDMRPGQVAKTLSKLPGTFVYMPPEALDDNHCYGPSLDIFSFGHLSLFTLTQVFPGSLLPGTYPDPKNPKQILARSELERRQKYLHLLEAGYAHSHPFLVEFVKQCLQNVPEHRPGAGDLLASLQKIQTKVEGKYGSSLSKVDIFKVRLARDMRVKDMKIEDLIRQKEQYQTELNELMKKSEELEAKNSLVEELLAQLQDMSIQMAAREREIAAKDGQIHDMTIQMAAREREIAAKDGQIHDMIIQMAARERESSAKDSKLQRELRLLQVEKESKKEIFANFESREIQLKEELQRKDAEIVRLREKLGELGETVQNSPPSLPQLQWRRGPDMPFAMGEYVQSVLVGGKVYVGGGFAHLGSDKHYIVMQCDTISGKWVKLPPYRAYSFAMAAIRGQLVLVGGYEHGDSVKLMGVWNDFGEEWTYPYPDMPTARIRCSAAVYNEWLVVAGGQDKGILSSVEILNTERKLWYTGPPIPVPWREMKTTVVEDICYFMGGNTGVTPTETAYSVSLSNMISRIHIKDGQKLIWNTLPGQGGIINSTPVNVNGFLLALGGKKDDEAVTDIQLYQPSIEQWVKVGDLPLPRCVCTGVMINHREILVAGGWSRHKKTPINRTDIATITYPL